MKSFILKIKKRENRFYRVLYSVARWGLSWSLPVNSFTRPIVRIVYLLHILIKGIVDWFVKSLYSDPLFRSQCVSVGKGLWIEKMPYLVGYGNIYIGDNIHMFGKPQFMFGNRITDKPALRIGSHTIIAHNATFTIAESVEIGKFCVIATNVLITDYDGHPIDYKKRRQNLPADEKDVKPVKIGDDVWLGTGAIIMKGVSIGDRSIIGANAVVTKNVPPDTIVAGNPAVVIRTIGDTQSDEKPVNFEKK